MSNHPMRVFSTAFKEGVVRRLESGEALATVSKELGIARKLLYEWRWAWRREGAAGLNRKRGPKPGRGRAAVGERAGAALAGSPPDASGPSAPVAELARAKARIDELERMVGRQQVDLDFFRKALRLMPTRRRRKPRRIATRTLRGHRKNERERGAARRKPTPSAMTFSNCADGASFRAPAIIVVSDPTRPARATRICAIAIQRIALQHRHYGYRRIAEQLRREGRHRQRQARAPVDARGQSLVPARQAVRPAHDRSAGTASRSCPI